MLHELDIAAATTAYEQAPSSTTGDDQPRLAVQGEKTDLEIPKGIWLTMFACYALFFGALLLATGREKGALFMIVVSIIYTVIYFGVASVLFSQNPPDKPSLFAKGIGPLMTNTGPMSNAAVKGQILTIPFCLALFGVAIAVIRSAIFG